MNIELFIESLSESEKKELKLYFLGNNMNRITIEDFINNNKVSTRLSNILQATKSDYSTGRQTQRGKWFDYIDEVEESDFRKIRNAGNKSWNEFKSLLLNN